MKCSRVRRVTMVPLWAAFIGAWMLPLAALAQGQQATTVEAKTNSEVASSATPTPGKAGAVESSPAPPIVKGAGPGTEQQTPKQPKGETAGENELILLAGYVVLLVLVVGGLHLVDSVQAYRLVRRDSDELWKRLPDKLSADDSVKVLERLASLPQSPTGIAGTTRSILAYSLIIILGIAVFHLLTVSQGDKATDSADKLLTLLAGSLTTAIGFYFGTKATSEGVTTGKAQETEKPAKPSGHIEKVDPPHAKHNDSVVIQGTGFGKDQPNVMFGAAPVKHIEHWSESSITVKVPDDAPQGKVDVFVNPPNGTIIVGKGLFTVD